ELEFPGVRIGRAETVEELGGCLLLRGWHARTLAARAAAHQELRAYRRAAGIIAAHPVEHLLPFLDVVRGAEDALQGVAAGAAGEELLLLVGAGNAGEPFAIGKLRGEIAGLVELEIGLGAARRDLHRLRAIENVAGRPDRDRVLAGIDAAIGKAVFALVVGHHSGGDGRAFLL